MSIAQSIEHRQLASLAPLWQAIAIAAGLTTAFNRGVQHCLDAQSATAWSQTWRPGCGRSAP